LRLQSNRTDPERINVDIFIVGAGPAGLLCAFLARLCGLSVFIADRSSGPLRVGRADALNARSLQLLEIGGLFSELYPFGKTCNTSSVWANGNFVSRQSTWWEDLEGCFHKHFLMLGQAFVEQLLDRKLSELKASVRRKTLVNGVNATENGCVSTLSSGEVIESRFVIGADGSHSFVRQLFNIPFEITRPQLTWAVLDGVIESDFPKVPEIIVFQTETSDVAWIPRERDIDRFYIRMDTDTFSMNDAIAKINRAMHPHSLNFKEIEWFSQFSVKESVAANFSLDDRIFLVGDACHIHSVNGGMGLNTGLSDAFNLIWKIHQVIRFQSPTMLLRTYEQERKPVALRVVETSGALVRTTKQSETGMHATDYVKLVEKRAGNITGMGIRYGEQDLDGSRLFDFMVSCGEGQALGLPSETRVYSLLDYRFFTLLIFSDLKIAVESPDFVRLIQISPSRESGDHWADNCPYHEQILLVRPDSYIAASSPINNISSITDYMDSLRPKAA